MTDISDLKDGVYDKVISKDFDQKLKKALESKEIWADREDVDGQEAVGYLSSYLEKIIRLCLKDIADQNKDSVVGDELSLTNQLINSLSQRIEGLGTGHDVTAEQFLLKSLEHRANKIEKREWEVPSTSLSKSFLFTNSRNDVSMVHELAKEIACADRIDMLVSFIRFSGLSMILPYLRQFTNQGGKLRVVTTTYMGATDPKAVKVLSELPNTEVRISYNVKETRLHAKSYMFYRESGFSTAYVGKDSGLNGGEVGDDEFIAIPGDKGRPNELGEHVRHIVIKERELFIVPLRHCLSCQVQVEHAVSGEVLQLDSSPRPTTAPCGAVELEHSPGPAVAAGGIRHGAVLGEG